MKAHLCVFLLSGARVAFGQTGVAPTPPSPTGTLVDIGTGQHLHVSCMGVGAPAVVFENGAGDFSMIWSRVQQGVSRSTRACSYDRGGYAWSDPGARPRTYAQLNLELRTALARLGVQPPYVLVGQSYGGLVVRAYAAHYPADVVGMVLVDAAHEDERFMIEGKPVRAREWARHRPAPPPHIAIDSVSLALRRDSARRSDSAQMLDDELKHLDSSSQTLWLWAEAQPLYRAAYSAEMDWSPEELARMHDERVHNRQTLGLLPLTVLASTPSSDSSGAEHSQLQRDLASLSSRSRLIVAHHAGHNIHVDDPDLVIKAIDERIEAARRARQ